MRRLTVLALGAAIVFSLALLAVGLLVPVYSSESVSSSGESVSSTETLVQVNGLNVLIVLAIPLVISLLVVGALRMDRRPAAWLLTGSLGCFAVLAIMTIGFFVLPVVIALAVACATADPRPAVAPG